MAVSDLKPRTVGELLDAAFYVYRRQFVRLLTLALVVAFPALVIAALYSHDAGAAAVDWWERLSKSSRANHGDINRAFTNSFAAIEKLQPFILLSQLLQSIERAAGIVTMAIVGRAALARQAAPPIRAVLAEAAPRLPGAVLVQLVSDFLLGYCICCCLPLGIALMVLLACTNAAIALERGAMELSLRAAMPAWIAWAVLPFAMAFDGVSRSFRLTWSIAAVGRGTLFLFFVFMFVSIADTAAVTVGVVFAGPTGGWYWAQHCAEALVLPVSGLAIAFWHADLRTRREGLDFAVTA